ncbi:MULTISPECIES: nitroreductase family protein [Enterococcus]|uniref:nitroreductase family protein n=1 Tax=Enterococcus TaxID=1350 RepID=UPI00287FC388|nr:nitroreductase family protein [Enterococcus faecium]
MTNLEQKSQLGRYLNKEERFLVPRKEFYDAPAFIIVSTPRDYKYAEKDTACAIENMLLASHAKGLGGVWVNQLNRHVDTPYVRKILDDFGVPSDHIVHGSMALGYPKKFTSKPRKNKGKVTYIK